VRRVPIVAGRQHAVMRAQRLVLARQILPHAVVDLAEIISSSSIMRHSTAKPGWTWLSRHFPESSGPQPRFPAWLVPCYTIRARSQSRSVGPGDREIPFV
jgi:hypothetical protein